MRIVSIKNYKLNEATSRMPDYEGSRINKEQLISDIDDILSEATRSELVFFVYNRERLAYAAGYDCSKLNERDYNMVLITINEVLTKYKDIIYP